MNKFATIVFCAALTVSSNATAGEKYPVDGSNGVVFTGGSQARAIYGKTRNSLSAIESVNVIDRGGSMLFQIVADDGRVRSCNTIDRRLLRMGRGINRNDEVEMFLASGGAQTNGVCSIVKVRKSTRYQLSEQ